MTARRILRGAAALALTAAAACPTTSAMAAPYTDSELAERARDGYREKERWSPTLYRKLAAEDGTKADVHAVALERLSDNSVLVSFGGTKPKNAGDVLADLGIGAKEAEQLLKRTVTNLVRGLAAAKILKQEAVDRTIAAIEGTFGGFKVGTTKAVAKGSPRLSCPRGAFFDIRKGGECWSCPSGTRRTVLPVTSKKACERRAQKSYARAKDHGKGSGVLKTGCGKGRFYDIGKRKCYSCPSGYRRSVSPVDGARACVAVSGPSWKKARYVAKALCPRGSFFDLVDKGSCWACPQGYRRNVTPVKSGNACIRAGWEQDADKLIDLGVSANRVTEIQLDVARGFLARVMAMKDSKGRAFAKERTILIGHSLGGFIAQVLAAQQGFAAVTFNAPGAANYDSKLKSRIIRNISRKSDLVGTLGTHVGERILIPDLRFDPKKYIPNAGRWLLNNHHLPPMIADLRRLKR